jgi:hypothetical protein
MSPLFSLTMLTDMTIQWSTDTQFQQGTEFSTFGTCNFKIPSRGEVANQRLRIYVLKSLVHLYTFKCFVMAMVIYTKNLKTVISFKRLFTPLMF